jgi:hypothetical protein
VTGVLEIAATTGSFSFYSVHLIGDAGLTRLPVTRDGPCERGPRARGAGEAIAPVGGVVKALFRPFFETTDRQMSGGRKTPRGTSAKMHDPRLCVVAIDLHRGLQP